MGEVKGSHLSIGEVLGLLLEEFPDVTISKIRFLESQGLIEPERTPSGYRKFLDGDVELLRVILREQRENFLPLRVIKDRIDSGEIDTSGDGAIGPDGDGIEAGVDPEAATEAPSRAAVANHPAAGRPPRVAASGSGRDGRPGSPPPDAGGESTSNAAARLLPGVLVDRDELCAMASITSADLAQLEEYGVIAKRGGPGELYGDDAVAIAATSGAFMRAGVDVRHLRSWRTSAEREAGLYEQLIVPLLRQRNPQARQHAVERLDELNALGAKLRTAMMRAALRRHLDA